MGDQRNSCECLSCCVTTLVLVLENSPYFFHQEKRIWQNISWRSSNNDSAQPSIVIYEKNSVISRQMDSFVIFSRNVYDHVSSGSWELLARATVVRGLNIHLLKRPVAKYLLNACEPPCYFVLGRDAKYCDLRSACLSVCLSARIAQKPQSKFREILYTCYLWPWLGPPPMAMQYVMYFLFCGWRHVFT